MTIFFEFPDISEIVQFPVTPTVLGEILTTIEAKPLCTSTDCDALVTVKLSAENLKKGSCNYYAMLHTKYADTYISLPVPLVSFAPLVNRIHVVFFNLITQTYQ